MPLQGGRDMGRLRRLAARAWRIFRAACVLYVLAEVALEVLGYSRTEMASPSMAPTLQGEHGRGDRVLIDLRAYGPDRPPRRGELVYIVSDANGAIIKRVAGLPGEVISIVDGRLNIDGKPVDDPPVFATRRYMNAGILNLPESRLRVLSNHYFVLGDNTRDSQDSRYLGGIPMEEIRGRCVLRYWPLSRFGVP